MNKARGRRMAKVDGGVDMPVWNRWLLFWKHMISNSLTFIIFMLSANPLIAFAGEMSCSIHGCQKYGACARIDAERCVPRKEEHCRASEVCRDHGMCKLSNFHGCVVASEDDCATSNDCKQYGKCHLKDDRCLPLSDADCKQSTQCGSSGECELYSGTDAGGQRCVTDKSKGHCYGFNSCRGSRDCRDSPCGRDLLGDGWKEIARCDGHAWSYLMERDGEIMQCSGINARSGPTEDPCKPFSGTVENFKKCTHSNYF